jgi:hypothetical protein
MNRKYMYNLRRAKCKGKFSWTSCYNLNDLRVCILDDNIKLGLTGTDWEVVDSTVLDQTSNKGREDSSEQGK